MIVKNTCTCHKVPICERQNKLCETRINATLQLARQSTTAGAKMHSGGNDLAKGGQKTHTPLTRTQPGLTLRKGGVKRRKGSMASRPGVGIYYPSAELCPPYADPAWSDPAEGGQKTHTPLTRLKSADADPDRSDPAEGGQKTCGRGPRPV